MSKLVFSKGAALKNRFGVLLDADETVMQQRVQWAGLQLQALHAPVNPTTLTNMVAWATAEGGGFGNVAAYNPLNDTQPEPGSTGVVNTGGGIMVQAYVSEASGIQAVVTTLQNGLYNNVLLALAQSDDGVTFAGVVGACPWGTNGTVLAECLSESQAAVAAYWVPPSAGDIMFIDQVPNFPNQVWMFVPDGQNSYWRKCPTPTQYPVEPDTTGAWFNDWDHMENGVLVKPS